MPESRSTAITISTVFFSDNHHPLVHFHLSQVANHGRSGKHFYALFFPDNNCHWTSITMAPILGLNNDILSLIVAQVTKHTDRLSLRQTSRVFEPLVSHYLFRQVTFSPVGNDLARFLRIAYNPRLSKHVEKLIFLESEGFIEDRGGILWEFGSSHTTLAIDPRSQKIALFWHSFAPLDIPSGSNKEKPYKVQDGLVSVFLEAIARMPKLHTFSSVSCEPDFYLERCGQDVAQARLRDLERNLWPCAFQPYLGAGASAPEYCSFLKGAEIYLLPALGHNNAASNNRWFQLHWQSCPYFKPAQFPLKLMHVPCLSENLQDFSYDTGEIDRLVTEPRRRHLHLETQHKLLSWLANANNLRTLQLGGSRLPLPMPRAKRAHDNYFFDLLVGQEASPNPGGLYLPRLVRLRLVDVSFSQAAFISFIARHADTLRCIELHGCRLEFDTVKRLARLRLHLDKFEVTSVTEMIWTTRLMVDRDHRIRVFEYIAPESLLRFINDPTAPDAAWESLDTARFGRIPYKPHFNFLVTTEDVRGSYQVTDGRRRVLYHDYEFEPRWETLVELGLAIDFRQPSHDQFAKCVDDEQGDGTYYRGNGVIYPTDEAPRPISADSVLLEKLKQRALEVSLSPKDMEEVQALMESCKREEDGHGI